MMKGTFVINGNAAAYSSCTEVYLSDFKGRGPARPGRSASDFKQVMIFFTRKDTTPHAGNMNWSMRSHCTGFKS